MPKRDLNLQVLVKSKESMRFKSHILTKKTKKRKLALTHDTVVHKADESNVKQMLRMK